MSETITEERVELMVSPTGESTPTLRPAHFLNPSAIDGARSGIPSCSPMSSLPRTFYPKEWPLQVKFTCWRRTPKKWVQWVNNLHSTYETQWKNVGIYESIINSKYEIDKSDELLFGIAEKWSPTSNTFVFPWGEATITLEDILVLGGCPVLGASVLSLLNEELKEIETKLIKAWKEALKTRSNKVSVMEWIDSFFNKGRELEHEAFLSAWLSMFVFPNNYFVNNAVFPIAINLARGNKIALAPALLASIYRDLDMLKESIVALPKFQADCEEEYLPLDLSSPFWLVQIWAWERIQSLQPKPRVIHRGDPLMTKWQKAKPLNVRNVRLVLDSAGEEFNWRPYAILKHYSPLIYPENEMWVTIQETNLDEKQKLESFIVCVRVSELVGLDCIRQYLPHRVAMQFGFDQDVPGRVPRFNQSHGIARDNYSRTVNSGKLYIPPRLFEADVTTRYLNWWKNSVMGHKDPFKDFVKGKRTPRSRKLVPQASEGNIAAHNGPHVPSGFPPEHSNMEISGYSEENDDASVPPGTVPKRMKLVNDVYMAEEALRAKAAKVPVPEVPPGFPPRHNTGGSGNSVRESEPATFRKNVEASMEGLGPAREGGNGSTKPRLTNERESPASEGEERTNEPERKNIEFEDIAKLGERISRLETLFGSLLTEDRTRS